MMSPAAQRPAAVAASLDELAALYEAHFAFVWRTLLRLGVPESAATICPRSTDVPRPASGLAGAARGGVRDPGCGRAEPGPAPWPGPVVPGVPDCCAHTLADSARATRTGRTLTTIAVYSLGA